MLFTQNVFPNSSLDFLENIVLLNTYILTALHQV